MIDGLGQGVAPLFPGIPKCAERSNPPTLGPEPHSNSGNVIKVNCVYAETLQPVPEVKIAGEDEDIPCADGGDYCISQTQTCKQRVRHQMLCAIVIFFNRINHVFQDIPDSAEFTAL